MISSIPNSLSSIVFGLPTLMTASLEVTETNITSFRSPLFSNSFLILFAAVEWSSIGDYNAYSAVMSNTSPYVVSLCSVSVTLLPMAAERIEAMKLLNFLPKSEGGVTEVALPVSVMRVVVVAS